MSDKLGLIKVEIRLVKKDEELVDRIMKERDLPGSDREATIEILRHNVWTIQQFADISGLAQSTIANMCRPAYRDGEISTRLDHCYPFADLEGLGPKFIVRNEKSVSMLPQPEPVADDAV